MTRIAAAVLHPTFSLDPKARAPLHAQLYERVRHAILGGHLRAGSRLPSSRSLAADLGVSRTTVMCAFDQLLAEGYIEGRRGTGTYVAHAVPDDALRASRVGGDRPVATQAMRHAVSAHGMAVAQAFRSAPSLAAVHEGPFRSDVPDPTAFPHTIWATLVARHTRHFSPEQFATPPLRGYRPLREAIAAHLSAARGVRATADQVLILPGAYHGLTLAARALLDPGDTVWIEDPASPRSRHPLAEVGACAVPVPVDDDGLDVGAGIACAPRARMAIVAPSHQFPRGATMSLARRFALLRWAREADAWIVEDDYDSEYRYAGRPLQALQGLDTAGRVIYHGTFEFTLSPGLRLTYLVVPPDLADTFAAMQRWTDAVPPVLEQAVLADFLAQGHYARHLRRVRGIYGARQAALVDAVSCHLRGRVAMQPADAGMHLVGWLPSGVDDRAVAARAAARGILVAPMSAFHARPALRGALVFGYIAAEVEDLRGAVERLARALASL